MSNTSRTIHTKLYSNIAKEILSSVIGQLSDGMWENSTSMEKYWKFADVDRLDDDEVVIRISTLPGKSDGTYRFHHYTNNGFYEMSDVEVIQWFTKKIKHIAVVELKDNDILKGWSRDNASDCSMYLAYHEKITVQDIYYVYEFLLGRNPDKHSVYTNRDKVIGTKLSEAEADAKRTKLNAIEAENKSYGEKVAELEAEKAEELKQIEEKYSKLRAEVGESHKSRLDELTAA